MATINIKNTLIFLDKAKIRYTIDDNLDYLRLQKNIWFYFMNKDNIGMAETFRNSSLEDFNDFYNYLESVLNSNNKDQQEKLNLILSHTSNKKFDKISQLLNEEDKLKLLNAPTKYRSLKVIYTHYVELYECPKILLKSNLYHKNNFISKIQDPKELIITTFKFNKNNEKHAFKKHTIPTVNIYAFNISGSREVSIIYKNRKHRTFDTEDLFNEFLPNKDKFTKDQIKEAYRLNYISMEDFSKLDKIANENKLLLFNVDKELYETLNKQNF